MTPSLCQLARLFTFLLVWPRCVYERDAAGQLVRISRRFIVVTEMTVVNEGRTA